jgi:DNA-binding NarL/FixJ family response regulator
MALPWDEAEALKLWGRYLLRAHRRDEAVRKLNGSLDVYHRIGAGNVWTDPISAERDGASRWGRTGNTAAEVKLDDLSEREMEVLGLIARGKSNREIAEELFVSARTVERHIANIYGKIDVHSRTQATAYAFAHHLLEVPK